MRSITRCCIIVLTSAALFTFPTAITAEDSQKDAQQLGKAPGPNYETADQIRKMPSRKATVVQRAPCFVYLKTGDGKGFYVGSPASTAEVAYFLESLQNGKTYTFPDAFLDYRKKMVREIVDPVSGARWPKAIAELANHDNRFYGTEFIPCLESTFFYAGDSTTFNRFLKSCSRLHGMQLVIHLGSKETAPASVPQFRRSVDWEFRVDRDPPTAIPISTMPTSSVHLWLGGQIKWDDVEIPANIRVKSGGELEDVIRRHNHQLGAVKR